jgi:spoIIIJ-associated protein
VIEAVEFHSRYQAMSQEDVNLVVDFTNRVLESSGLDLKAVGEDSDGGFKILVGGDDVALLLGRNAELLDALEYLGNRILARSSGEEAKIVFDSGGYRARREKELRLMAEKAAEKVSTSRIPFTFDPMTPNERRIIHLALANDSSVTTESQGNGENRKVTVRPA